MNNEMKMRILQNLSLKKRTLFCKHNPTKPCDECIAKISGNVSGISGNVSGIYGNVSNIYGDVSGISGSTEDIRIILKTGVK